MTSLAPSARRGYDRDFRLLLGAFVLQKLATGCMLAGVDDVARTVLGSAAASTLVFVAFVGGHLHHLDVFTDSFRKGKLSVWR